MDRKVVVTGAGGQLGRELCASVPAGFQCQPLTRAELDIGDAAAVERCLAGLVPDVVINAAAYTAVDAAEKAPREAFRINGDGPGHLARYCDEQGARLIHLSTDFVFDGRSGSPYGPDAATNPLSVYGRSKLAGELAVREQLPAALVVRTAWVYSRFGSNFVKTMLRLLAEREELSVVADQVGSPTWAHGLARAIWAAASRPELTGVLHWSDAGVCSWYDFALAIRDEALALGLLDRAVPVLPITTADYPTPAQRPAYSVLAKEATWEALAIEGRHWRSQLRGMLQELKDQEHG